MRKKIRKFWHIIYKIGKRSGNKFTDEGKKQNNKY